MIDTDRALSRLIHDLHAAKWIAVDTEADSLHAYPERLCLLQISFAHRHDLIDPLAPMNLEPVWPILSKHELILHGADYDLRLLHRGYGFVPGEIFDTMIAARLLGHRQFGLGHLVSVKLGVTLEKGPQKMDWGRRPLTERMERYARNDTRYLQPLAEMLRAELKTQGRLSWMKESCARLIKETSQAKTTDPDTVWRLKGSDPLSPKALAILRELWKWRETEARKANKPPYFILSHENLVMLATRATRPILLDHQLPQSMPLRRKASLSTTLKRAARIPPSDYPRIRKHPGRRLTLSEQKRIVELRDRRDRQAEVLGIDTSLIASRGTLVALAQNGTTSQETLMAWQHELLFGK